MEEKGKGLDGGFEHTQGQRHPNIAGHRVTHSGCNGDVHNVVAQGFLECALVRADKALNVCHESVPNVLIESDVIQVRFLGKTV